MNIYFTDVTESLDNNYYPVPSLKTVPDWYRQTPEYTSGERLITDGNTPHTVKKCIPVFDALTVGYIIPTYADVQVTQRDGLPYYEWPLHNAISFHPVEQAPLHPGRNDAPYPKWTNPWAIKTPPGYSCLFVPPMHNPNGIFTILPGIVDTDTYTPPVNFPFTLDGVEWEGIIPAGTPMVQVIPFKRDSWKMEFGGDKEREEQARKTGKLRSLWFNSYKRQFWSRKEFR
jgi:hypothetical protein